MNATTFAKRHEEASKVHVETANFFLLISVALLGLYSLLGAVNSLNSTARLKRATQRISDVAHSPVFLVLLWVSLCVWGLFYHFKSDVVQIARRYGQLALATSTLSVFLAIKPALLPYTYQTRLVSIHKWIGRTSIFAAFVHGVVYIAFYIKATRESKHHEKRHAGHKHKLFGTFNVFGMVSFAAFAVLLISSLGPFRTKAYYIFFALHRPLVIMIYILMIWHARPSSVTLIGIALFLMTVQVLIRLFSFRKIRIRKVETFGSALKLVLFEPAVSVSSYSRCASHIRLAPLLTRPSTFFRPSHPYTLIGQSQLIIRESRFKVFEGQELNIYGPFSSSFNPEGYTHLLVFAGGSGISLLPSLNGIADHQNFVWITRQVKEAAVLSSLELEDVTIYVTASKRDRQLRDSNLAADQFELQEFAMNSDDEASNLETQAHAELPQSLKSGREDDQKIFRGRPNFDEIFENFYTKSANKTSKICVISCGPQELVSAVTSWASSRNLDNWAESFSL